MFFLIPVVASVVSGIATASTAAIAATPVIGETLSAVTPKAGTIARAEPSSLATENGTSATTATTVSILADGTVTIATNGRLLKFAVDLVK